MILKEAVLISLEEIGALTNYLEVYKPIAEKKYYDFGLAKTPSSTISAQLGDFIRNGDTQVKRIKQEGGTYSYYLTKNEDTMAVEMLANAAEPATVKRLTRPKRMMRGIYISC